MTIKNKCENMDWNFLKKNTLTYTFRGTNIPPDTFEVFGYDGKGAPEKPSRIWYSKQREATSVRAMYIEKRGRLFDGPRFHGIGLRAGYSRSVKYQELDCP